VTFVEALLWPVSLVYGIAARVRGRFYRAGMFREERLDGVVISVGNLTVGGTGKTPMVLYLAERLLAEGKQVAVLTRGYRGFLKGSGDQRASAGAAHSASQGTVDEPALLRNRVGSHPEQLARFRVAIGADRAASGREARAAGFDWFLLDDGFQHFQLARDLDIVLIDSSNPFGGGRLLPSGRLREPKSGLTRADIIVITRGTHAPAIEAVVRRYSSAPIFYATLRLDGIVRADEPGAVVPENVWRPRRYFAYCGIGNPNSFFGGLREWGVTVAGTARFPDHHIYSSGDRERVESDAKSAGADALLCTEKDFFNFGAAWRGALPVFYARVSIEMQNADAFWTAAEEIFSERRPGISL
jgi:tetraacyldisaccharide 4'-kinase